MKWVIEASSTMQTGGLNDRQAVWLFFFISSSALFNIALSLNASASPALRAFSYSDLTSGDMRRRLPVCMFRESPPLIQHDGRRFRSLRRARDLWAQTSSCEMSHPSVLNITVNINDSLFAICGPSGSSLKGLGRLLCIQFNMIWQKLPSELSRGRAQVSLGNKRV